MLASPRKGEDQGGGDMVEHIPDPALYLGGQTGPAYFLSPARTSLILSMKVSCL